MGYIAHDVVVAVISDYDTATLDRIEEFRGTLAASDLVVDDYGKFLLGPVVGVNGYTTYVFAPDGSKEGWVTSDEIAELREAFREIATGTRYPDGSGSGAVVHVRFGGDYGGEIGTTVVFTTDPTEVRT